ncbi:hypothetical protein [Moorena bouillonii]|uniref:hypothetical protein n=1 Tax=Moorena bouillonii TaxID=207920 RepID=UPI00117EB49A|nr:hypothetical protein [Moorena bouillonii]
MVTLRERTGTSVINPKKRSHKPLSLVDEPLNLVNEPLSLVNEPLSLVNEPLSLVNEPLSLVNEPLSLVNEPLSLMVEKMRSRLAFWPNVIALPSPDTSISLQKPQTLIRPKTRKDLG